MRLRVLFFALLIIIPATLFAYEEADGPLLGPETLTPAERAAMETRIAAVQAEIDRQGADWTAMETGMTRLSPEERRARLMHRDDADFDWPADDSYEYLGYPRERLLLDWRENGGNFVTGIRDQGSCGSCWDFASTAAMESAILTACNLGFGVEWDLSEQYVLSCIDDYLGYSDDCDGGLNSHALIFGVNFEMIDECCFPYQGNDNLDCSEACDDAADTNYSFQNWGTVCYSPSVTAIQDALNNYGPVPCSFDVYEDFDTYGSGVYRHVTGEYEGGHAVLIIGYDDEGEYWIAKNSWGRSWGMQGFFKVAWDSNCDFGRNTRWVSHSGSGYGLHALMEISNMIPETCETLTFTDRSLTEGSNIVEWEWDFEGDGIIDATGPGPHEHVFLEMGNYEPTLRIVDNLGNEDMEVLCDGYYVYYGGSCWDGPTWYVDAEQQGGFMNGSPDFPYDTIQLGIAIAAPGDTVLIMPGIYTGLENRELDPLGKSIVIRGGGDEAEDVILDGEDAYRLFHVHSGEDAGCRIENLTLRRGHEIDLGGAVLIENSSPFFSECLIDSAGLDGLAPHGAGVWASGSPSFVDCRFIANVTDGDGGGIYFEGDLLSVAGSQFHVNSAEERGGAIYLRNGAMEASDLLVGGNFAALGGGGIYAEASQLDIARSIFEGNWVDPASSFGGGGISLASSGSLAIENSLFTGNIAPLGGGINLSGGTSTLIHLTSWNNEATMAGGGLALLGGSAEVANCVFWGDTAPDHAEILAFSGITVHHSIIEGGFAGDSILDEDPLFADAAGGDFMPDSESPCIAAGSEAFAISEDIFNSPRPNPSDTAPDLGACESPAPGGTGVDESAPALQKLAVFPNPFNPTVNCVFTLARSAHAKVQVHDLAGRRVALLAEGRYPTGSSEISWTAVDDDGRALSSGIYLLSFEADGTREARKLVLLK